MEVDESFEKKVCRWLLFVHKFADNPWRAWAKLGAMGLKRKDVDSYILKRGYNPFEGGAYVKFVKENFEYVAERANDP
jgi:hypothetical protein